MEKENGLTSSSSVVNASSKAGQTSSSSSSSRRLRGGLKQRPVSINTSTTDADDAASMTLKPVHASPHKTKNNHDDKTDLIKQEMKGSLMKNMSSPSIIVSPNKVSIKSTLPPHIQDKASSSFTTSTSKKVAINNPNTQGKLSHTLEPRTSMLDARQYTSIVHGSCFSY
jgi:hypothetical protein